jgi:hypothetical protein
VILQYVNYCIVRNFALQVRIKANLHADLRFGIEMASLFEFRWAVDQDGYEIEHVPAREMRTLAGGGGVAHDRLRSRDGPLREYRPMDDHPGLWHRFAACADTSGLLAFVRKFGLLFSLRGDPYERVDDILRVVELVRQIAHMVGDNRYPEAAELWNSDGRPRLTSGLVPTKRHGKFEFKPMPLTLHGAILLQAAEAIASNQQWRHCRNDGCSEWFRVGDGAHTSRREFCSDKCRVAWARHHKAGQAVDA